MLILLVAFHHCGDSTVNTTIPLPINGAQRNPPEIRAELGQLGDVISHLHKGIKQM